MAELGCKVFSGIEAFVMRKKVSHREVDVGC